LLIGWVLFGDAVHSTGCRIDLLGLDLESELLLLRDGKGTAHRVASAMLATALQEIDRQLEASPGSPQGNRILSFSPPSSQGCPGKV